LLNKLYEDMPLDARVDAFVEAHDLDESYTNRSFFDWHGRLTGSCPMGREQFARDHEIDLDGSMTVREFIHLTEGENIYGSAFVRVVKARYA